MRTHIRLSAYPHSILLGVCLILIGVLLALTSQHTLAHREPVRVIIDTDMGVDDAAALAWLLSQPRYPVEVVGITTVAGNTTIENSTNNVLTVLDTVGRTDIPVVIGAAKPLSQTLSSTGALAHGPDGLWFAGLANPHDLGNLPTDAPGFICDNAAADVKLIALGPLTNVAQATAACPNQMQLFEEIIILGGTKREVGFTPVAAFNIWIDPEAADRVFQAGLFPHLIPIDAFQAFTLDQENINELAIEGTPTGRFLATILQPYLNVQAGLGGAGEVSVPDVTAVMVALDEHTFVKESQPALLKMVPNIVGEPDPERLVRGQTVIGLTFAEKVPMIANDTEISDLAERAFTEPGFDLQREIGLILAREPDNIDIVLDIRERPMHRFFMRFLTD